MNFLDCDKDHHAKVDCIDDSNQSDRHIAQLPLCFSIEDWLDFRGNESNKCVRNQNEGNFIEQFQEIEVVIDVRLAVSEIDYVDSRYANCTVECFKVCGVLVGEEAENKSKSAKAERNMI